MENINTKVLTALQSKDLDFDVVMREAYTLMNGVPTPNGKFNPVRVDADGKESLISGIGFSKDFTPVQNRDAFTVIGDLAELADIDLVNVGSWGNGAGVFAQINLGDMIVAGSDKVGKYLSIVNSHDGSRGFSALITPYRYFCSNQISASLNDARRNGTIISLRHSSDIDARMQELTMALKTSNEAFDRALISYEKLAGKVITAGDIRQVLAQVFPFDPKVGQRGNNAWQRRIEAVVDRFNDADNGRAEKMTAWNLYNAVQGSIQHGTRKTAAYEGSVLMGDIAHKSTEALKIVEMVTLDGHTYEVAPEFDEVFSKMAVA